MPSIQTQVLGICVVPFTEAPGSLQTSGTVNLLYVEGRWVERLIGWPPVTEHPRQWEIHQASGHAARLRTSKAFSGKRTHGQLRKSFICMTFHLSRCFMNNRGTWPLLPSRCHNNTWLVLQHQLSSCSHLKAQHRSTQTVLQVFLHVNDPPSLPDNVFFLQSSISNYRLWIYWFNFLQCLQ